MLSDTLQDLLLGIVPDTDTMSGMFGAYQQHELDNADKALDVILKSMAFDHEDWHKKNDANADCPGPMYFGLRAIKGYLLSHSEDLTDEEALGIFTMCIMNVTRVIEDAHGSSEDEKLEKIKQLVKLGEKIGIPLPDDIKRKIKMLNIDVDDAEIVTDDNIVSRMEDAMTNPSTQRIIKHMQYSGIKVSKKTERDIRNGLTDDALSKLVMSQKGELTDDQFDDLIGVDHNASGQEKVIAAVKALAEFPLPSNIPADKREKLEQMQERLRNQINNP